MHDTDRDTAPIEYYVLTDWTPGRYLVIKPTHVRPYDRQWTHDPSRAFWTLDVDTAYWWADRMGCEVHTLLAYQ